ncbi:hypothetical protein [Ectopseudomonas oleovorans]|uniref:hypothetical protein n=1 Tax=Ectopseudomonas oleovorans TaxID=301 RepID=UPI0010BF0E11|nr:hypothetical protein [Pseudomonas oleovorans]
MSLINQIREATELGHLIQPFTVEDLKNWIKDKCIVKDNGEKYAQASINAILSNSDRKNTPTSNLNKKILKSRPVDGGKHEYWF